MDIPTQTGTDIQNRGAFFEKITEDIDVDRAFLDCAAEQRFSLIAVVAKGLLVDGVVFRCGVVLLHPCCLYAYPSYRGNCRFSTGRKWVLVEVDVLSQDPESFFVGARLRDSREDLLRLFVLARRLERLSGNGD